MDCGDMERREEMVAMQHYPYQNVLIDHGTVKKGDVAYVASEKETILLHG